MVQWCDFVLVQVCVLVLSRSLSQVVLQATRWSLSRSLLQVKMLSRSLVRVQKLWSASVSESEMSAHDRRVVGWSHVVVDLSYVVVVSPDEIVVAGIVEEIEDGKVHLVLSTPLSAAFLLLLDDLEVFVDLTDKQLLAANDWAVWSPLVIAITAG